MVTLDTTESVTLQSVDDSNIVSNKLLELFQLIIFVGLITIVSIFGIIGNIINILVYRRIGFKESITVSLFALAISDLALLTLQLFLGLCQNPSIRKSTDLGLLIYELGHSHLGVLRTSISRISIWITVLITMERCVCIVLPIKVKFILTRKRSIIIIVSCAVLNFLSGFPIYLSLYVGHRPIEDRNRTRLGVLAKSSAAAMTSATAGISVFIQLLSFVVIGFSVCALLIALSHQKRHARMARAGLRESYFSRPSLTWTLLRRQTESVVPTHPWPGDATTTVNPVENPLTPFTTGKQRRRNRSEAEETTDSTAPSVYNIPYKHFPRSKQIAENVPNEAHHRPLFVSLNAEFVDCDQASPATDHRASEPSTSQRITPACPPATSDVVTVTRLTQQRLWKVGKMIAVLSLIIFIANTPSTVLMFISTLEAQIQTSNRYGNMYSVSWGFAIFLETLNASVNIIVYYNMSSVYRNVFLQIMCCCRSQARVAPSAIPLQGKCSRNRMEGRGPLIHTSSTLVGGAR